MKRSTVIYRGDSATPCLPLHTRFAAKKRCKLVQTPDCYSDPSYHLGSRCGLFPVCIRLRSCRSGLGTGQSFGQKSYLAGVVRLVFANVEPFPIDVYLVATVKLLCIGG